MNTIKGITAYFRVVGNIWRIMETQSPTSEVYFRNLGEMKDCVITMFDNLRKYRLENLTQDAHDDIDLAEYDYLSTLSKYGVGKSYPGGHCEELELERDLRSRGLLKFEPSGDANK